MEMMWLGGTMSDGEDIDSDGDGCDWEDGGGDDSDNDGGERMMAVSCQVLVPTSCLRAKPFIWSNV